MRERERNREIERSKRMEINKEQNKRLKKWKEGAQEKKWSDERHQSRK